MAIKAYLPTLDGLDDSMKALYKESDGGFIPDVEQVDNDKGIFGLMNNVGLKNALTASRNDTSLAKTALGEANAKLSVFSKYEGKTTDDFDAAFDALANGKTNVDVETAVNLAKDQFNVSLKAEQDKSAGLFDKLLATNKSSDLNAAINRKSNVINDNEMVREMLLSKMDAQTKISNEGITSVVNAEGVQVTSSKIDSGAYMTCDELLDNILGDPANSILLKPSGAQGSGGNGSSGGGNGNQTSQEKVNSGNFEASDLEALQDAEAAANSKLTGN